MEQTAPLTLRWRETVRFSDEGFSLFFTAHRHRVRARSAVTPETQLILKIVAGTVLVIALIIGFFERLFRPSYLMLESSRSFPSWVGWLGWGMATLATLTCMLVDFFA